ncbi:MAG: LD-carboxypeptidase [Bacteroidota bacterium]
MIRRHFFQKLSLGAGVALIGSTQSAWGQSHTDEVILPKPLKKGDTLGIVGPSSAVSRGSLERSLKNMKEAGFQVKYTDNVRVKKGFLAGTDQQRLDDLHAMFKDPEVDGVYCIRGGYGAGRLLNDIDYELIRNNPKFFMGYSDITALLFAIYKHAGMVCFHGPNVDSTRTPFMESQFQRLIMDREKGYDIRSDNELLPEESLNIAETISPGKARGKLIGGNLTLISTLMGTPHEPDFTDAIVLIEDIGEAPYRVDRMLTQLILADKFRDANGIALGMFNDCEVDEEDPDFPDSMSLREVLTERLGSLGIPVVWNLPYGHVADNAPIPIGVEAELDADDKSLKLLGAAFS